MTTLAQAIEAYIRAKDENRPYLLSKAFATGATVYMVVNTAAIAFPPSMSGVDAIADTLVRRFGQTYENVYTFCLSSPPDQSASHFSCRWLVGMSEKQDGAVRVGTGLYDWFFARNRVEELKITIASMQTLNSATLHPLMSWLSSLPYPWCPTELALSDAPDIEDLGIALEQCEAAHAEYTLTAGSTD